MDQNEVPEKHKSTAAVQGLIADSGAPIKLCQSKGLNNLVEQDHRAIKRIVRPMLGFKSFWCAVRTIVGIETIHMIRQRQFDCPEGKVTCAADQDSCRNIGTADGGRSG